MTTPSLASSDRVRLTKRGRSASCIFQGTLDHGQQNGLASGIGHALVSFSPGGQIYVASVHHQLGGSRMSRDPTSPCLHPGGDLEASTGDPIKPGKRDFFLKLSPRGSTPSSFRRSPPPWAQKHRHCTQSPQTCRATNLPDCPQRPAPGRKNTAQPIASDEVENRGKSCTKRGGAEGKREAKTMRDAVRCVRWGGVRTSPPGPLGHLQVQKASGILHTRTEHTATKGVKKFPYLYPAHSINGAIQRGSGGLTWAHIALKS